MPGGWDLMAHGVIFADYNQQGGPRGEGKAESVNWGMLMEQHKWGLGTILFRQMFSAESLTSPHPGFPELFQTGETYHGIGLVDHQHPHNVFAELSLTYTVPLNEKISWEFYGGPSAEPALGPVTYLHRASAAELPMAPLGHHLQDSTHTSFGVVTTGFIIERVKLEGSAFNGREPNEERWSIQPGPLDSWSGRASVAPSRDWTAQYSVGRLEHPEALEPGSQWRQTASVSYDRPLAEGNWATSLVWGHVHKIATSADLDSYLLESTLNFLRRNYAFTRMELVDKDELFPRCSGAAGLPDRRLYFRRRARSCTESSVATRSGRGHNGLFQACRVGCGLWPLPCLFPDLLARASRNENHPLKNESHLLARWILLEKMNPPGTYLSQNKYSNGCSPKDPQASAANDVSEHRTLCDSRGSHSPSAESGGSVCQLHLHDRRSRDCGHHLCATTHSGLELRKKS